MLGCSHRALPRAGKAACVALALSLGFLPWSARPARAAGVEDTVGGTVGLGRAAVFGRVNDFMAVFQNPANLAVVPGKEIGFELRLPVLQACYDRFVDPSVEYKQPGAYEGFMGTEYMGKVCNSAAPGLTANTGWAQSFDSGWGYGIGLFTPAAVGGSRWGNDTLVSWYPAEDEPYQITEMGVQSPTRQMGIQRDAVTAFLMLGLGAQPIPQLRFGVSAGWGVASIYNKSVVSVTGGTFRDQEVVNEIRATDWAIPRLHGSMVVSPWEWLDLFAVGMYQGDVNAEGNAVLTANGVRGAPQKSCSDPQPGTHCRIDGVKLDVPFHTLEVVFGLRLAMRRSARERVLDPMRDEIFDIEVDVSWAQTSHVDGFKVTLHDKTLDDLADPDYPKLQFANLPNAAASHVRSSTIVPKNWEDTWSLRAGGDLNLVPGRFSVRAGMSYATRAVPVKYMNIDYWPVEKLGIHAGATLAFGWVRISAAYAHIMYQPVEVAVGTGGVKDIATVDEANATAVNEGRFTAAQNIFSLQLNASF